MKNRNFIRVFALAMAMMLIPQVAYATEPTASHEQNINKTELIVRPGKDKMKLAVGDTLGHTLLTEYVMLKDESELPEGYTYAPVFRSGEKNFQDGKALTDGTASIRVQVLDEKGNQIAVTKECIKVVICDKVTKPETETITHMPYIKGYEDGTFRADQAVTREEFATMVSRLMMGDSLEAFENKYSDISDERYSALHVAHLVNKGILTGYEDGLFRPHEAMTRAEVAKVIDKVVGYQQGRAASYYKDVPTTYWAHDSIMRVSSMGYMNGSADESGAINFRPDQAITRAESVIALNQVFDRKCDDVKIYNQYSDLQTSHWAYEEILDASILHDHTVPVK